MNYVQHAQHGQWIDAKVSPPGHEREVLIFVHDLGQTVAHYSTLDGQWLRNGSKMFRPDYWMPLPESPKP